MRVKVVECGCCGAYHRINYRGDCRNDWERYYFSDGDNLESANGATIIIAPEIVED